MSAVPATRRSRAMRRIRARPRCSAMPKPKPRCSTAYRGGRIPHAWLIGGAAGHRQGDAGLSHGAVRARASRSVAAGGAGGAIACRRCRSSGRAPYRRAGARRSSGAGTRPSTKRQDAHRDHRRADVRQTVSFFGSTAGEGGWRVCIVDTVDELNRRRRQRAAEDAGRAAAANALLLLVSHRAGPRAADDSARAAASLIAAAAGRGRRRARRAAALRRSDSTIRRCAAPPRAAEGSVGRALDVARRLTRLSSASG